MRIALPFDQGQLNPHFGSARAFWICDATREPLAVTSGREVTVPAGAGCGVIPSLLKREGVELVIAGGLGQGAMANLQSCGIKALVGVAAGQPEQIVHDYLADRLAATGVMCVNHVEGKGHGPHGHGRGGHGAGHGHHGHGHGQGACCQAKGAR